MEFLLIAVIAWAIFIWYRGRAESRNFKQTMQIGWFKNNPEKLTALGATQQEIDAAIAHKEKIATDLEVKKQERINRKAENKTHRVYNAYLDASTLVSKGKITVRGEKRDVAGAKAYVEHGATSNGRMTATRVVGGGVLLGPVGMILGGMAKKDRNKVYLIVELPDGDVLSADFPAKDEPKVRKFAGAVSKAGKYYISQS